MAHRMGAAREACAVTAACETRKTTSVMEVSALSVVCLETILECALATARHPKQRG
jgi:hypothetical protein